MLLASAISAHAMPMRLTATASTSSIRRSMLGAGALSKFRQRPYVIGLGRLGYVLCET